MQDVAVPNNRAIWHRLQPALLAILLGIIGALVNSLSVPFLTNVELIFGNAAIIIGAMLFRPPLALLVALIAVTPMYFYWGHPFGYLTFGLEALVISYLRSRGRYVLFAELYYWLLIGMPLTALLIWLTSNQPDVYWLFVSLKQGFNAAIYATIGCIIAFILDRRMDVSWRQQPRIKRKLSQQLVYAIIIVTTLALISASLYISRGLIVSSHQATQSSLENRAQKLADSIHFFVNNQKSAIVIAANWMSHGQNIDRQTVLEQTHLSYAGFLTMLVADKSGEIVNASPASLMSSMTESSVKDRDYFQQAINNQSLFLSPVFLGRGFGRSVIIAISAPYYQNNDFTTPAGIVEGSLDLSFLQIFTETQSGIIPIKTIITDQHNKIIYADPTLNIEPLAEFQFDAISNAAEQQRFIMSSMPNEVFAYAKKVTPAGWQVYTIIDFDLIIKAMEQEYLAIFVSLLFTLIMSAIVAFLFGQRITKPLNFIIQQINKFDNKAIDTFKPLRESAAVEINHLYQELKRDKNMVEVHQKNLEQMVNERTRALNQANEKLQELALNDGLTKVHNRRYLDNHFAYIQKTAQRNLALMSVIIMDLDHFKRLNDNYGHLAGDEVLVKVASLVSEEFSRETDTIVRFGGEEFLVIAPYITAAALAKKLENLRVKIAETEFVDKDNQQIFRTSSSFGAIIADAEFSEDLLKWVKVADECLYQAKNSGRNKVVITDRIARVAP